MLPKPVDYGNRDVTCQTSRNGEFESSICGPVFGNTGQEGAAARPLGLESHLLGGGRHVHCRGLSVG